MNLVRLTQIIRMESKHTLILRKKQLILFVKLWSI